MKCARLRAVALSAAWGLGACLLGLDAAAAPPQYSLAKVLNLPGDTGWDYLAFEQGGHRLFIAHGTQVDVIDTKRLVRIGEIADNQLAALAQLGRQARQRIFTPTGRDNMRTRLMKAPGDGHADAADFGLSHLHCRAISEPPYHAFSRRRH